MTSGSTSASPAPGHGSPWPGRRQGPAPCGLADVVADNGGRAVDIGRDLYQRVRMMLERANPTGSAIRQHRHALRLAQVGFFLAAWNVDKPTMERMLALAPRTAERIRAEIQEATREPHHPAARAIERGPGDPRLEVLS